MIKDVINVTTYQPPVVLEPSTSGVSRRFNEVRSAKRSSVERSFGTVEPLRTVGEVLQR